MIENQLQPRHLVLVRHGESEGDVRRAAFKRGESYETTKSVDEEEVTGLGEEQSRSAGAWIRENVLARYALDGFGIYFTSPTYRTAQSAMALELSDMWQCDDDLTERNRGLIRGWPRERHQREYPESYTAMKTDPLHWVPPKGESILDVAVRAERFLDNLDGFGSALVVTHRDWMWAAQRTLENLTDHELAEVNTDDIKNAQIIHYTNVHPETGMCGKGLMWKRSVCPWDDSQSSWEHIDLSDRNEEPIPA